MLIFKQWTFIPRNSMREPQSMTLFQHARLHGTVVAARAYAAVVLAMLRDALHSALAVFAFLLSERLFAFALAPVPGSSTVSPLWLTSVLRARGWVAAGVTVCGAELQPLVANRGLTGTTLRLAVRYSVPPGASPGPATFIIKMRCASACMRPVTWHSGGTMAGRRQVIGSGQHREAQLYASTLQPQPGLMPRLLYACGSALFGEFVVIMEDLTATKSTPANFVFGAISSG